VKARMVRFQREPGFRPSQYAASTRELDTRKEPIRGSGYGVSSSVRAASLGANYCREITTFDGVRTSPTEAWSETSPSPRPGGMVRLI
jgi:hypothetical protein